jgi:hypothetical protein
MTFVRSRSQAHVFVLIMELAPARAYA